MKTFRLLPFLALLAGCAGGPPIDTTYTSVSQDSRVQYLVIHFTSEDFAPSLKVLTQGPVSAHYLVRDDPPTVYRLVDESRRAYQAGVSSWKGQTQLNAASIGIEIVNLGDRGPPDNLQWFDYPKAQIDVVVALVKDIVKRHQIRPDRIVGHSDIAPQRKVDPGPRFPWKRLADEGLIPWPDANTVVQRRPAFEAQLPDVAWFQDRLEKHGFAVPKSGELDAATRRVVAAFQMKYRPARFDGTPDAETAALLDALLNP
jgi:N-acetylmuramoyl-L-alanine amidase